ncbi:MAG: NADH-quinone oxidoreductase subunit D [Nocardioidaceae bacterium]
MVPGTGATPLTVSLGAAAATVAERSVVLDLGSMHPSAHGGLRLRLTVAGDRIVSGEPAVGYLHRGVEKLFEVRDYRQIVVLANRHDWHSAFSSELGVVLAVERMLGMEVPVRATWARTLLAELNRVLNHLAFLGCYPVERIEALAGHAHETSERVRGVMEEVSGGRMHYMFNRVGGLKEDLPAGWLDRVDEVVTAARRGLVTIAAVVGQDETFVTRTTGIGVLSAALVEAYGVSGPAARASGVDLDLRRDDPYLAYGELAAAGVLRVPTRTEGDCYARFALLLDQAQVALDLVAACADRLRSLPAGPVGVRLPKILRAPEGSTYVWTENPLGVNGYYLVSRGEKTPWRMKLRSASFNNVSVLPELLPGCRVADLVPLLGSLFFVVGDIDR